LEENIASLIGAMLTIVEQALKAQGDDALGMHAARASAELAEPPEDTDDESSDDNGYAPEL
jgi:hypothetical protein